jgi:thiamine pyrophosphate-dependent acetolactate synthase large subunit-like protein
MVALSMADGYARLTNKPQCVIVHVDVGTQALGQAVHNASAGRAPILIFAGLSPYTIEGELRGSRTEFIHWLQDVHDQRLIVSQYCRYTAEIKTGKNIKQMVNRALQFAMSGPQGPVYLCGAREVMEEELDPYQLNQAHWKPVAPSALDEEAVEEIAKALVEAREPLIVTGYSGRNHKTVPALVELADVIKGIRVLDTGGSDMCFPADHPAWLGFRYGIHECIRTADVILVVDCDVPWINTQCRPSATAKVIHIDIDPLKQQFPVFYLSAEARYRADSFTAISQLSKYIKGADAFSSKLRHYESRLEALAEAHRKRLSEISRLAVPKSDNTFGASFVAATIRRVAPRDTIWAIEAVTNTAFIADQIQPTIPGSWINCGGGGLGWSGGGMLGIKLATDAENNGNGKFVCCIVGDGSYMFSVPGTVYWISQRYKIPVLTIVLNNNGWNAPRKSLLLVHPDGEGSRATNEELNISFAPTPDYAGIAKAAAGKNLFTATVERADELEKVMKRAVESVESGIGAVVEVRVVVGC